MGLSSGTTVPAVLLCCGLKGTCWVPPWEWEIDEPSMSAMAMSTSPFSTRAVLGISSPAVTNLASTPSCSKNPSSLGPIGG